VESENGKSKAIRLVLCISSAGSRIIGTAKRVIQTSRRLQASFVGRRPYRLKTSLRKWRMSPTELCVQVKNRASKVVRLVLCIFNIRPQSLKPAKSDLCRRPLSIAKYISERRLSLSKLHVQSKNKGRRFFVLYLYLSAGSRSVEAFDLYRLSL
jgi:hypothetical protein